MVLHKISVSCIIAISLSIHTVPKRVLNISGNITIDSESDEYFLVVAWVVCIQILNNFEA